MKNLLILFLFAFFSCIKTDTSISQTISQNATAPLLYHETFETSTPFAGLNTQFETSHAFTLATAPVFQGSRSGRFELRDTDPENNGGVRAEAVFPIASNLNRWYSFAVYFPSADYKFDSEDEVIGQWKQHEHDVSSAISLRIKEDKFRLTVFPAYKVTSIKYDLGLIPKDKWLSFVIHVKHSTGSDGLIELWIDGVKKLNRTGSNMYKLTSESGMTNPEWKIGVYKSGWNGSQTTMTTKRVLFYDDIKLGNENATYAEMVPTKGTTPPPPPTDTTSSAGFVFVDAHTEKDLYPIVEGGQYTLLGKTNIRLNTNAPTKFELSGPINYTYTDKSGPIYCLWDNDGSNYYYGLWKYPAKGNYTLKTTTGTVIKIIHFTIK